MDKEFDKFDDKIPMEGILRSFSKSYLIIVFELNI